MAGIVSKDIYRLVKTTTTEIDIMDRIYHGDVDAYNIDIEFYGVTSISGTCNLHFVLPDGTALDKDASDGVVIDGNNVKYTLPTYLYQQSGNLTMYVQFMNSNIYTPLKVNFKNIVAIPDGGEEVVATTTYPVWYDEVVTNEDERVAAELIRVSNEVSRVTAETARSTWEEFSAITVYAVGEKVYYPTTGSSYILHTASGVANTLPTDTDYWQIIVEKGASGTIDELSSTDITGVIAGDGTSIITASANDLPYVNTTSGLTATDAQAAIDELASEKEDSVNIGNRIYTEQNYVTNGESITSSLDALDVSLNAAFDAIDDLWKFVYPVGCLFETTDSDFNPQTHFGGTWEQYGAGRVTVGYSASETEFNAGGKTGGAKTHTHLVPSEANQFGGQIYIRDPENDPSATLAGSGSMPTKAIGAAGTFTATNTYKRTSDASSSLQPYITVFRWRRTA